MKSKGVNPTIIGNPATAKPAALQTAWALIYAFIYIRKFQIRSILFL